MHLCPAVCTQTYEGGLGGEPGNEAHGGYTFCGLAALMIAGCPHALDLQRLLLLLLLLLLSSERGSRAVKTIPPPAPLGNYICTLCILCVHALPFVRADL
jgi:hypothetical protein